MLGQYNTFSFTDFKGDVSEIPEYSVCASQMYSIMHRILFLKRKMLINSEGMVCDVDRMIHVPCFSSTVVPNYMIHISGKVLILHCLRRCNFVIHLQAS